MTPDPGTDSDDLGDLLAPHTPPAGQAAAGLRADVLARTGRVLAARRVRRRVAKTLGIAGIFALGIVAGRVTFDPPRVLPVPAVVHVETVAVPVPVVVPVPVAVPASPAAVAAVPPPPTPDQLELAAEQTDPPAAAARLYRAAGDAHLDRQDYPNAARCYRAYLRAAGDTALSPAPGDSWLLAGLKARSALENADVPRTDG